MAKCASLQHIFDKPLPSNPTLMESLSSWRHHITSKPPDLSSFTEIFGELHFKDHSPCLDQHEGVVIPQSEIEKINDCPFKSKPPDVSSVTAELFGELHFKHHSPCLDQHEDVVIPQSSEIEKINDENNINVNVNVNRPFKSKPPEVSSFTELFGELYFNPSTLPLSPLVHVNPQPKVEYENNASDNKLRRTKSALSDDESSLGTPKSRQVQGVNLQLCTEGLGFESFDVERDESVNDPEDVEKQVSVRRRHASLDRKLRYSKSFPPPISSIGGNGKPWLYFRSFRRDGRFILRQFRIPTQVFFNAYREDGHLRLHPVRPVKQSTETEDVEVKEEQNNDNVNEL